MKQVRLSGTHTMLMPEAQLAAFKYQSFSELEDHRRIVRILIFSFILNLVLGISLYFIDIPQEASDFFERLTPERTAKLVIVPVEKEKQKMAFKKEEEERKVAKEKAGASAKKLKAGRGGGGKSIDVTSKGVLAIISGKVKGKNIGNADIFAKGGFASDIDAVLEGIGGLKRGGTGGFGRKGLVGLGKGAGGFSSGGSGFGSGTGGIDDLLDGLSAGLGAGDLGIRKSGNINVSAPPTFTSPEQEGMRSQQSIMRVVMANIGALRHAYEMRLKVKPGLKGKVTIEFTIAPDGDVISCKALSTTINDPVLEEDIIKRIFRWRFDRIPKGNVTVVYPFAFSPES